MQRIRRDDTLGTDPRPANAENGAQISHTSTAKTACYKTDHWERVDNDNKTISWTDADGDHTKIDCNDNNTDDQLTEEELAELQKNTGLLHYNGIERAVGSLGIGVFYARPGEMLSSATTIALCGLGAAVVAAGGAVLGAAGSYLGGAAVGLAQGAGQVAGAAAAAAGRFFPILVAICQNGVGQAVALAVGIGGAVGLGVWLGGALLASPPAHSPKPPGWTGEWEWRPESGEKPETWHWWDPRGGEWRWHPQDKWHPEGHWDHNPWDQWNSPWKNIPHK